MSRHFTIWQFFHSFPLKHSFFCRQFSTNFHFDRFVCAAERCDALARKEAVLPVNSSSRRTQLQTSAARESAFSLVPVQHQKGRLIRHHYESFETALFPFVASLLRLISPSPVPDAWPDKEVRRRSRSQPPCKECY